MDFEPCWLIALAVFCGLVAVAQVQPPQPAPAAPQAPATPGPGRGGGRGGPAVVSPQIEADGRVTFRVLAPNAAAVTVGGDIKAASCRIPERLRAAPAPPGAPGGEARPAGGHHGQGRERRLERHDLRRVRPGAWRYTFNIDGVTVVDSRNVNVSPSQTQVQSLLYVPGDFSETRDVPHGTVGLVRYVAKTLGERAPRDVRLHAAGIRKGTGGFPCST